MCSFLSTIFKIIKASDKSIRFCFVTGVLKLAGVGLFSGANQFKDFSLREETNLICGYS